MTWFHFFIHPTSSFHLVISHHPLVGWSTTQLSQRRGPYFARHSSAKPPPKLRARSFSCSFSWLPRKMCTCHRKIGRGMEKEDGEKKVESWMLIQDMAVCQNLVPLVNIKIAGKWMFIPLKMVLIGIDPYPYQGYRMMSKNRILKMPLLLRTWITRVEWHQRLADVDSGTNCQRLPRVAQHEGQNQDPGFHRLQNQGSFRRWGAPKMGSCPPAIPKQHPSELGALVHLSSHKDSSWLERGGRKVGGKTGGTGKRRCDWLWRKHAYYYYYQYYYYYCCYYYYYQ